MAEIVNLNKVRKQQARTRRDAQADANRQKYGRTKAEKAKDHLESTRLAARHDGNRRDEDDPSGGDKPPPPSSPPPPKAS
jgi:hypothetical protein